MAVNTPDPKPASSGRRLFIGTNVLVAVLLVVGIVAVLQAFAFSMAAHWDMTTSGVNSLGEGTQNLLKELDTNIRLTSLYFETDREEEDQQRYRQAARNLIDLYEVTNRSKVTANWINPLKDHDKLNALLTRLREKPAFKAGIDAYRARLDEYSTSLDQKMKALVKAELDRLGTLGGGIGAAPGQAVASVENLFLRWSSELEAAPEQIEALVAGDNPQYTLAGEELKSLYRQFSKALSDVAGFGTNQVARNADLPDDEAEFLRQAGTRYADVVSAIETELTKLEELEPLAIDDVMAELVPTGNPILVETDTDARVVDFSSVWPPIDPNVSGARASIKHRAFKGEEKVTAAILRVTQKEQTAVVFVRYGGTPLFAGGFAPGQPVGAYAAMKEQLEDANFVVSEWDLKTSPTQPPLEGEPTRTIFVVLKPTAPPRGPMGQQSSEPPFVDSHREALVKAMGDNPRALFITGWWPGPFGVIPSSYEYNEYLESNWGIAVDTTALLVQTTSVEPGKYNVMRRDFYSMPDTDVADHEIVRGLQGVRLILPWCAPLERVDDRPEGVEIVDLVTQPAVDGLWGIKNIKKYEDQLRERQYLTKVDEDLEGPFTLAMAATKGEGKIVVISARDFAVDNVAFAREMSLTPQGLSLHSRNPGNVGLLANSLHWLNDNVEYMNIGKPIDAAVLEVDKTAVRVVQGLTILVWPVLALVCGLVAWRVRRR